MLKRDTMESLMCSFSLHQTSCTTLPPPAQVSFKSMLRCLPPSHRPPQWLLSFPTVAQTGVPCQQQQQRVFPFISPRAELTLIPGEAPTLLWLDPLGGLAAVVPLYFRDLVIALHHYLVTETKADLVVRDRPVVADFDPFFRSYAAHYEPSCERPRRRVFPLKGRRR